jgi:hypothetical protein
MGNTKRNANTVKNSRNKCYQACGKAPDSKNIKSNTDKAAWLKKQSDWINCQMQCVQLNPITSGEKRKIGRTRSSMGNMLRGGRKTRRARAQ